MQKRATNKKNQNMLLNGITGKKINPRQADSSQDSKTAKVSLQGGTQMYQSGGIVTKRSGSKKVVKDSHKRLVSMNGGSNQVVSLDKLERVPAMGRNAPVPGFINSDSNWRFSRLNHVPNSPTVKAENSNEFTQSQGKMPEELLSPHSRHGTENDTVFINSLDFNNQQNLLNAQGQQQYLQSQAKFAQEQNGTCEVMLKQPSHSKIQGEMKPFGGTIETNNKVFQPSKTGGWTPDHKFTLSQRDFSQKGSEKSPYITGFLKQGVFVREEKKSLGLYGTQKQISDISAKIVKKKDLKIVATAAAKSDYNIQNEEQDQVIKSARESKTEGTFGLVANATVGSMKAKKDLQALEESVQENDSIINEIKVMQQIGASQNFHTSDEDSVKNFESSIVQKWTNPKGSLIENSSNSQLINYQQRKLNEIKKGIADIKELTHLSSTQQSQQTFQDSKPVSPQGKSSPTNEKEDVAQTTWSVMITPAPGRNLQHISQRSKLGTAAQKSRSNRYETFTQRRRNKSQSGSHHVGFATLSTDGFSDTAEKTLKENISKSQSKLTKNYGMVYNKIHWDQIHEQKKQIAEHSSVVPLFKIRQMSSMNKEKELQKVREQELQELDTAKFLKYLKRDEIVVDKTEFGINEQPTSPKFQPRLYTSQFKSYREPLNKFRFKSEIGRLQLHDPHNPRTPRIFRHRQAYNNNGKSNYEAALNQNDFGPLYEHSSLLHNNMEDQMDIIDRHDEILNNQPIATLPGGGFSVQAAQERDSYQRGNIRVQNLNHSSATVPINQLQSVVQNIYQQNSTTEADEEKSNDVNIINEMKSLQMNDTRQQMPGTSAVKEFYDASANSISDKLQQQSQQFIISEFDTGQGQIRIENKSPSIFGKEKQNMEEATRPSQKKTLSPFARACRPGVGIRRSPTKKKISVAIPERQLSNQGTIKDLAKLLEGKTPTQPQPSMQRLVKKRSTVIKKDEYKMPLVSPPPPMASTLDKEELEQLRQAQIVKPLSSKQFKGVPIPKSFLKFDLERLQEVTSQNEETQQTQLNDDSASVDNLSQCSELTASNYVKPTPQMKEMNKVVLMLEECFNTLQFQEIQKVLNTTPNSPGLRSPLTTINKALTTQSLSKDIKIYQQDCQRMVTAIDDYPAIQLETPIDIQLTKGVKLYYRFQLKGLPSPLMFDIQYNDVPAEQSNMEMYLSTTHKTPNKEGHELKFLSQKKFYLQADKIGSTNTKNREINKAEKKPRDNLFLHPPSSNQVEEFQDKYLYICFDSTFLDLGITVTIKLIQSRQAKNKIKLQQYQQRREDTYQEAQNHFNEKEPYYRAMLDMVEEQRQLMVRYKEMIQKEGFQKFYPDPKRNQEKFVQYKSREQLAKANKAILDIDHLKRKLFMMQKWDLLRGIKDEQFTEKRRVKRNIVYSTRQAQRIKAYFILRTIANTFKEYKIAKERKMKSAFICFMYNIRYKRKLRMKGATPIIRATRWSKNTITAAAPAIQATCEERSLNVLKHFLKEWSFKYSMQGALFSFIGKTYKIQERLQYKLHQKEFRKISLRNQAWMKELAKITMYFNSIKQNEKQKQIWSKIAAITEEQKVFMVEIHYKRQLVDSHIRFMRWYIEEQEYKAEQDRAFVLTSKYKSYKKDLPNKLECLEYLTEFLESSLEKYPWIHKIDEYLIAKREKEEKSKIKKQVTKRVSKNSKERKSALSGNKKDSKLDDSVALKKAGMLLDTTNNSGELNSDDSSFEEKERRPPMPIFQFYPRDKPFLKQLIVRAALLEGENEMMQVRGMLRKFDK